MSCSIVGRAPERTAAPPQEEAGPQGPRSMADEGVKGVMMVDSPPHQPQKKMVAKCGSEEVDAGEMTQEEYDRKAENQGVPSGSFPRMKKPLNGVLYNVRTIKWCFI